jgi:small GTP-binding protein
MTIEDQIKEIEDEIKNTPYNKSTQHHIGKLKAKLARLKADLEKRRGTGVSTRGYGVKKAGDATVVLVGPPNVGKSSLLNLLSGANSDVADYGFTTLEIIPGILKYKGAEIQILDLPGIVRGASKGRGRGREILAVVRNADMVLLVVDVHNFDLKVILKELYDSGIRLNKSPPDIVVHERERGGITISSTIKLKKLPLRTIREMIKTYGFVNADIVVRTDVDEEGLLDFLEGNRTYVPAMLVLNKVDLVGEDAVKKVVAAMDRDKPVVPFSVVKASPQAVTGLKERIFNLLDFIRVYLKPKGGKPDMSSPMILRKGDSVENVCRKLHKDFVRKFRYAVVTGRSAKFADQTVGLNHMLKDEDILTIITER